MIAHDNGYPIAGVTSHKSQISRFELPRIQAYRWIAAEVQRRATCGYSIVIARFSGEFPASRIAAAIGLRAPGGRWMSCPVADPTNRPGFLQSMLSAPQQPAFPASQVFASREATGVSLRPGGEEEFNGHLPPANSLLLQRGPGALACSKLQIITNS